MSDGPSGSETFPRAEYVIELGSAPVSFQGSQGARRRLEKVVGRAAAKHGRWMTGEVEIQVEWFLAETRRWESPHTLGTPDLDNILKPMIDGLCGLSGLLIDDCQVQSITCNWIDWPHDPEQKFTLRVKPNLIDDSISHQPLIWLDMGDHLCWPLPAELPAEIQLAMIDRFKTSLRLRDRALADGIELSQAELFMPSQRRFPRARLLKHQFEVRPLEEHKGHLEGGGGST